MAIDKNKINAEATRLVQKGQYDKAIKAYEKILAEDRREVRTLLKVGELQQRKGDVAAAAATFNQVAEFYGEQGFFLKAVAVFKQVAKLSPDDARVNEKLAGLYQQLGLMNDAMVQLQAVAAAHERAGDQGRYLDALRRMHELDPENVATCSRLGDLYAKAGRTAEALDLLRRAASQLRENRRGDDWVKVAERIFQLTPQDMKLARDLAQQYLARGDAKKALGKLQLCHGADKGDVETLRLMAQAFRDLGQSSKTVAVYKALAGVHADQGRREDAALTWRMVRDLAPDDPDAEAALAALEAPPAAPATTAPPPPPIPTRPAVIVPPVTAAPAPVARVAPPPVRPAPTPEPAPLTVTRIITEADVYAKYGLHRKALEHVQKALELDPGSPDALERIRDASLALGDRAAAADAAARVLRTVTERGLADRVAGARERLQEIDPAHPDLGAGGAPPPAPDAGDEIALAHAADSAQGSGDPHPADDDMDVVAEVDVDDLADLPPEAGESPALESPLASPAEATPSVGELGGPAPVLEDAIPEKLVPLDLGSGDATSPAFPAAEPFPEPLPLEMGDEPFPVPAELEPAPLEPLPPPEPPTVVVVPADGAAPPAAEELPPPDEVELVAAPEGLEELAFYEQQGMLVEALDAARDLAAREPGNEAVQARLRELEARVASEAPVPGAPAADEAQYSVADVLDQFKKGVERSISPEDSSTHYDLGIAYKEMGLLDEALGEFRTALSGNDRAREIDILTMLGLCHGMKGQHREAVAAFQQALRSEHVTPEAEKALRFEIGAALEALGEREQALGYFQAVARIAGGYRDVAARVARLGGGAGRPPAEGGPAAAPDEAGRGPVRRGPKKNIGFV